MIKKKIVASAIYDLSRGEKLFTSTPLSLLSGRSIDFRNFVGSSDQFFNCFRLIEKSVVLISCFRICHIVHVDSWEIIGWSTRIVNYSAWWWQTIFSSWHLSSLIRFEGDVIPLNGFHIIAEAVEDSTTKIGSGIRWWIVDGIFNLLISDLPAHYALCF